MQLQRPSGTDYTHMKLVQTGTTLSGVYLDAHNKKYPLAGTVDGEAVRMIVSMPDGTTLLLEGKLDNAEATMKNNITGILHKLGAPNRTRAVTYAVRQGWLVLDHPVAGRAEEPRPEP